MGDRIGTRFASVYPAAWWIRHVMKQVCRRVLIGWFLILLGQDRCGLAYLIYRE